MGAAARAYVEREHDLDHVAGLYAAALEEAAGDAAVRERVLREVAEAAAAVGVEPELLAPELQQAALVSPDGRAPAGHARGSDARVTVCCGRVPMWLWLAGLYAVSVVVQLTARAARRRRRGSWSTSSSTPTWRGASPRTGDFLIRGVHASYGVRLPAAALARVRAVRVDARRLPVGARRSTR